MNKVFLALILSSITISSIHAAPSKQPIQYNADATQKLKAKLDSIPEAGYAKIGNVDFLKSVDELLLQGANPNTFRLSDTDNTLVVLLFAVPFFYMLRGEPNFAALEHTIKNALERGGNIEFKADKGFKLLTLSAALGSPTMVKLAIDHGADITQKDETGDTVLMSIEKALPGVKAELAQAKEQAVQARIQKHITRFEQIRDILKAAEQKK